MSPVSRQVQLVARPSGEPRETDFRVVETAVPDLEPDQILVRNRWMSVDPYMRGRMNDAESYIPPFALDAPLDGGAVGRVVASTSERFAEGDTVLHGLGWRDVAVLDARGARAVDPDAAPEPAYLGILGMPGLTAYAGLLDVAGLQEGDVVFVSGAAGAVGSIAGQIAKLRGHRVIGSAGSAEKVAYLVGKLGFDAAFNYRDGDITALLAGAAPDGIDVYFDNVGAEHLEAAIACMNDHGRIAMCGAVAGYNSPDGTCAPRNLALAIGKRLTLRGFLVTDHGRRMRDYVQEMAAWLKDGRVAWRETVVDGLDAAPRAFIGLLRGENTGKMLVRLDAPEA
ncbi:NADP-dependent oxidoreductase [Capillimicrobium parvum]|uniref:NADP-dependent oxidoreductase YfmJ n=1 Tax=Capillimicrobium parvum TaxID=2884022 RepID=A0A9E7BZ29_9ACTN|nr:NADP-dependent oxidoreductase [Capillimicrobium parvum]UGS34876.1 Putative NADP-dependent oxidoreductase YfmJ [Capillimicrobium parvum]